MLLAVLQSGYLEISDSSYWQNLYSNLKRNRIQAIDQFHLSPGPWKNCCLGLR